MFRDKTLRFMWFSCAFSNTRSLGDTGALRKIIYKFGNTGLKDVDFSDFSINFFFTDLIFILVIIN